MISMLMLDKAALSRMDEVHRSWLGTPYMAGQSVRGAGVDCLRLMTSIMDELFSVQNTSHLPKVPHDIGLHDQKTAMRVFRYLLESYPSEVVQNGTAQPGDVVVTRGERNGVPNSGNHLAMIGRNGRVIHAVKPRVCFTSLSGLPPIEHIYRPLETHRWR